MAEQDWEYQKRHIAVIRVRGRARIYECASECGNKANVWATIHETDGSDPSHYLPMCHPCHNQYDHDLQHTPESDYARGATWRGKKRPAEFGEHMSRVLIGRTFSEDTKRKMSESQKRLAQDPEHLERLRERGRKGARARWGGD